MHGSSCPRAYQPRGLAGSRDWVADSTYGRLNAADGECLRDRFLIRDGEVQYAWLIWGVQAGRESKPLGCYASREVALAAEEMMRELPEAAEWEDIWTTPWPLATVPRVNFRFRMTSRAQDD